MRPAVVIALALGASGCQIVFPLDEGNDRVPHVRAGEEDPGSEDLIVPVGETHTINTGSVVAPVGVTGSAFLPSMGPEITQQDHVATNIAILRVRLLEVPVGGELDVVGDVPLVIIADSVSISGAVDASAHLRTRGPGGGVNDAGDGGQGIFGSTDSIAHGSDTGGGGGAYSTEAGVGGSTISCTPQVFGGDPAQPFGDDALTLLVGGGAGGHGGSFCATGFAEGGSGGGAIQITATTTIEIKSGGRIVSSGGGGAGGRAVAGCTGGGGGGGSGGAIYLSAQSITNDGSLLAQGGGGGAGAKDTSVDGADGHDGYLPMTPALERTGGFMAGVGTTGGEGADLDVGKPGNPGTCTGLFESPNTGGGGGSLGRIVLRGLVIRPGDIIPAPFEL